MSFKNLSNHYELIMRVSLGFVFLWFGINEIIDPRYWSGYVPQMARELLPIPILPFVQGHGLVLVILGACLLIKFQLKHVGALAILVLLSIIGGLISMNGFDEIVVRDIGLLGLALAIWFHAIKDS